MVETAMPFAVLTKWSRLLHWARTGSLGFQGLELGCCGVELHQSMGSRFDMERLGAIAVASPREADLLIVAGTVTYKSAAVIKQLYEQMPQPAYVVAFGSCAHGGGPFASHLSYNTVCGIDQLIPVDIYVPGCPPRPEALLHGLLELKKLKGETYGRV